MHYQYSNTIRAGNKLYTPQFNLPVKSSRPVTTVVVTVTVGHPSLTHHTAPWSCQCYHDHSDASLSESQSARAGREPT
jgi:hypothetical protein